MKIDMLYNIVLKQYELNAAVTHTISLYDALTNICDHVRLILPHPELDFPIRKGITFTPSLKKSIGVFLYVNYIYCNIMLFLKYLSFIKKEGKPHIIYSRGVIPVPVLLSKILNVPIIFEINSIRSEEIILEGYSEFISKMIGIDMQLNCKLSNKIITVTQEIKDYLIKEYYIREEKILVITNGVNTNLFYPKNKEKSKLELNLDKTKKYVCFVGSLAPWQGLEYLIEAAPMIIKEQPETMFLIVGDGLLKKDLEKLVFEKKLQKYYIFTGSKPHEEVPEYINASDICVCYKKPLTSGFSPLKMYEYMACGKPVIASEAKGFEFVKEKKVGLLVEAENAEKLSFAIVELLNNEKLSKDMGENGLKISKQNSWNSAAIKINEICIRVMNK